MDLWLRLHFLFVCVCVCGAAPTPEECATLLAPSLNRAQMFGAWTVELAFTEEVLFQNILKETDSSWLTFSDGDNNMTMTEYNRIKGQCTSSSAHVNFLENKGTIATMNVSSEFHLLPSCPDCLLMDFNSTVGNLDQVLKYLNLSLAPPARGGAVRSLYLLGRTRTGSDITGREPSVTDADREVFGRQAACLGFKQEPHFHYDSKRALCSEEESVKIVL